MNAINITVGIGSISAEHARLLDAVNNANTEYEHTRAEAFLNGWRRGVESCGRAIDYCGADMYYINQGVERPMCCGVFLDWKPEGVQS